MADENGIKKFWKSVLSNFWRLAGINILYFLLTLPILLWVYVFAVGYLSEYGGAPDIFRGLDYFAVLVYRVPTAIFYALALLSTVLRGPLTMGMAFSVRNLISGRQVLISDLFKQAIDNLGQGILFGIAEIIIVLVALNNILGGLRSDAAYIDTALLISKWVTVFVLIFLSFLRPYLYFYAVSVKLATWPIIKNSAIFAIMNLWKNIVASLLICVFWFLSVSLFPIAAVIVLPFAAYSFDWLCYGVLCYPVAEKYLH